MNRLQAQTQQSQQALLHEQIQELINKHGDDIIMYLERLESMLNEDNRPLPIIPLNEASMRVQEGLEPNKKFLEMQLLIFQQQIEDEDVNQFKDIFRDMFSNLMQWIPSRLDIKCSCVDYYCLKFAELLEPYADKDNMLYMSVYEKLKEKVQSYNYTEPNIDMKNQHEIHKAPNLGSYFNSKNYVLSLCDKIKDGKKPRKTSWYRECELDLT